jgi:hypothetical protein
MPLAEDLFVDPEVLNIFGLPTMNSFLDTGSHDVMGRSQVSIIQYI